MSKLSAIAAMPIQPTPIRALRVHVAPASPRVQGEDASGAPLRALIAASVWRDRFGSDPAMIGRSIRLNGEDAEVIGVMPEGFKFPSTESVWVNLRPPPAGAAAVPGPGYQAWGCWRGVEPRTAAAQWELAAQQYRSSLGRPVDDVEPMRVERLQYSYNGGGTASLLATMLAMTVFVLLLAGIGVYGVVAYNARRRTREMGLRRALGASGGGIVGLLFRQSALVAAVGMAFGIVAGYALSQPLAPILPLVSADDPWLYLGVGLLMTLTTLLACWMPSRQAAAVDPMVALRSE